jgi:hypothetical protein
MNRITKKKCADWGWLYAPNAERAEVLANNQEHDYAVVLSGPIDARNGIENESTVAAISADIATATCKLQIDTCFYPKDRDNPHLKAFNCSCDNIELNTPIIFETVYRAKDHILNGQTVYGVLLTGKKKNDTRLICESR